MSMRSIRVSIATITLIFICIGVIMVYSASAVYALQELKSPTYFLDRHLIFLGLGTVLAFLTMSFDYRQLRRYAKPIMVVSLVLLVLVLIPGVGKASFGARRWFKVGMLNFQPSEFMKLAMLVYAADFLARKKGAITSFREGFLPLIVVMGMTCLLIVKQPDLGNTVLIAMTVLIMMFIAGARVSHLGLLCLMALPVLYLLVAKVAYRMRRIVAFLDPWKDSQGVGFQLTQSQIALGSGSILGVGLGKSVQKLFYLPAAHTDFILSIIGEELGLIGTMTIVLLFIIFIWQGARIAKRTEDPFGYFLSIGIVATIGLQALVNIGVSIGALPTKGLPLPFISYGGSALVVNMVAVALLLNISRVEDMSK
jgi:cell division protein FtsW